MAKWETKPKWAGLNLSFELKDFILDLLKLDKGKRLGVESWDDIKNHDFFKIARFDWQALEEKRVPSPMFPVLS